MNEPYVSFDTFTISDAWDQADVPALAGDERPVPILARLPRLSDRASAGRAPAGVSAKTAPVSEETAATIRFDVGTAAAKPSGPAERAEPAPVVLLAPDASSGPDGAAVLVAEEAYTGWLMQLENFAATHSRWIVLLVVIAALGLTLVLLRGPNSEFNDAPQITPLSAEENFQNLFARSEAPDPGVLSETPRDIEGFPNATQTLAAEGPVSSPLVAIPRAELIGTVEAPAEQHVEIAQQPQSAGYPRTATSKTQWPDTQTGSKLR